MLEPSSTIEKNNSVSNNISKRSINMILSSESEDFGENNLLDDMNINQDMDDDSDREVI